MRNHWLASIAFTAALACVSLAWAAACQRKGFMTEPRRRRVPDERFWACPVPTVGPSAGLRTDPATRFDAARRAHGLAPTVRLKGKQRLSRSS